MDRSATFAPPAPRVLASALAVAFVMPLIGFMVGVVWVATGCQRAGGAVLLASAAGLAAILALVGAGGY